jgi:hypothetical protein
MVLQNKINGQTDAFGSTEFTERENVIAGVISESLWQFHLLLLCFQEEMSADRSS